MTGAYWRVTGAQRESGADIEIVVAAPDRDGAAAEAGRLGVLVSRVEPVGGAGGAPTGAEAPPGGERLVRVYGTRPRDHLYIGWLLRQRKHLVITTHRIVLHERFLFSSRTATLDVGAVEGAVAGRITRWRVLIATVLIVVMGAQASPLLLFWSGRLTLRTLALLAVLLVVGLLLSRADSLGVVSAGSRFGIMRYGVRRAAREWFLRDVHSVLRAGHDTSMVARILDQKLPTDDNTCPTCGYPLEGLRGAARCPECGGELPELPADAARQASLGREPTHRTDTDLSRQ